jgi:predicted acetyltransferase
MEYAIRRASADDFAAIAEVDSASFGEHFSEQELEDALLILDLDRFLVATVGERIVGVTGDYPFTMTVPGGEIEVPGVTWVSVDPSHRRRGVLRQLMVRQLREYVEAGSPGAILTASESGIYGRYGYGIASHVRKTVVARRRVRLREPGDSTAVVRANPAEARKRMPEIHERWRAQTPGALNRTDAWWDFLCLDRDFQRMGMSALFYLVHDDGYVAYRMKTDWNDGDPRHLCWITDYVIAGAHAHRDLWQVLLGMDLVGSIESYRIPLDDPLPLLVHEPRQIQTTHIGDGVWLRPLDVGALLSARTYAIEVDVVLEVADDLFGGGRFHLTGGPDGAVCRRTDAAAGLSLDVAALGSVYLGGVRLEALARAGQVRVDDRAALVRLDRALQSDRLPTHGTAF